MRLQLQHVLTGVGVRGRKVNCQPLVNHAAIGSAKRQVASLARYQLASAQHSKHWGDGGA